MKMGLTSLCYTAHSANPVYVFSAPNSLIEVVLYPNTEEYLYQRERRLVHAVRLMASMS